MKLACYSPHYGYRLEVEGTSSGLLNPAKCDARKNFNINHLGVQDAAKRTLS